MRTFVFVCLFIVAPANAQDKPANAVKSISELRIMKVGRDTTRQEFLKMYPKARKIGDDQFGVRCYTIDDEGGWSSFQFLGDPLYSMMTVWETKNIARDEGWIPILKNIESKYGKAETVRTGRDVTIPDDKVEIVWTNDDCCLSATLKEHSFSVSWTDRRSLKQLETLKNLLKK